VRRALGVTFASALFLQAAPARADGGAWIWVETRVPLVGRAERTPRLSLRVWSDTRLMGAAGGLAQQFVRIGPILDVTSWFFLAAHGTIYADRRPSGAFDQEARLEIEPNFHGRVGPLTFNDRNRLEYRWRADHSRVRYRNQLRINYQPKGWRLFPFAWDEMLFDFSDGFNENRFLAGVAFMIRPHIRIEAGYLLRSRDINNAWQHDHVGVTYLFVGIPSPR